MYLEAMWHFFRWHLPIQRICIIYFPLGKLPGEYPDRIIVLPSSNRSKHEAILSPPYFNLPSIPSSLIPLLFSVSLPFLTNFGSTRIDFFEIWISPTFDLLIVRLYRCYISLWKNDSTFNQMVTVDFSFSRSTVIFFLAFFPLLLLFFFIIIIFFSFFHSGESTQVKRFWHWFLAWQLH